MKKILPFVVAICLCYGAATASEELNYNLVNLQADAFRQVDNDLLVVIMSAVAEANTAREAARSVNDKMIWASEAIRHVDQVKHQTMNYQTSPLYNNRTIVGWTVSQQIRLESLKVEQLTSLVGNLQDQLNVTAMQFEISPERRKETESQLITEALAAFTEKARLVTTALGAKDFRLVTISVNEGGNMPIRQAYAMEMAVVRSAAPAPEVAAGESRVAVTINGTVQLSF